jgi:hypothetical protein
VIARLERGLRDEPREVIVGYQNPVSEHVLAQSKTFHKIGGTMQWALYRTRGSSEEQ